MVDLTSLWPYVLLILMGFLPNEIWRVAGMFIGQSLHEDSAVFEWLKAVATGVIAALVAQLILFPPVVLMKVPLALRVAAIATGYIAFLRMGRSSVVGVLVGVSVLLVGAMWLPH